MRRRLVLPRQARDALRDRRRHYLDRRLRTKGWHDTDLVFTDELGGPITPGRVSEAFGRLLRRAGLPPMRFYDLRHSCATLLLAQGVPAQVVMELLGDSSITLTMNTYSHVLPAMMQEAADAMERALVKS